MIGQHFTTEMMQTTPVNEVVGNPGTAVTTLMEKRGNYYTSWDKEIADRFLSAFYELDNK